MYLGNSSTYYAALETVSASLAALIVYIYPAIVAVLTLRVGRPLEGRQAWLALGLALFGVVLAIGGIPTGTAPPLSGLLQAIASPIIYSIWIIAQARLSGERSDRVGDASDRGDRCGHRGGPDDDLDGGRLLGHCPRRRDGGRNRTGSRVMPGRGSWRWR